MSRGDWGRIGRRTEPFTARVTCDHCDVEMSAPALPARCPLCDDGQLHEPNNVTAMPHRPTLDLDGAA